MRHASQNVHIILPYDDLRLLRQSARAQKRSVAELIRQAIRKVYGGVSVSEKQQAAARLAKHRDLHMDDWSKVKAELHKRYD